MIDLDVKTDQIWGLMAELPEHIAQGYEELRLCAEAVAQLATHRDITPMHVSGVKTDRQIRKVLTSIIRLHGASEPAQNAAKGLS